MKRNVAILLFDEIEVLDFAGPFEVFAVTDELSDYRLLNVFTVGESLAVIRARNGLKLVPDHTLESAPAPDILVIPGGFGTRALLRKGSVLEWVRLRARTASHTVSVCTGSLVLAKAGLLSGIDATTHHECIDLLRELAPDARVHADRRFHDNDRILTAAGISAGIDVSLHLVARVFGRDVAEKTASYMEYHWKNDGGLQR